MPRALLPELCCLGHWAGLCPVEAAGTHQSEDGQRETSLITDNLTWSGDCVVTSQTHLELS